MNTSRESLITGACITIHIIWSLNMAYVIVSNATFRFGMVVHSYITRALLRVSVTLPQKKANIYPSQCTLSSIVLKKLTIAVIKLFWPCPHVFDSCAQLPKALFARWQLHTLPFTRLIQSNHNGRHAHPAVIHVLTTAIIIIIPAASLLYTSALTSIILICRGTHGTIWAEVPIQS